MISVGQTLCPVLQVAHADRARPEPSRVHRRELARIFAPSQDLPLPRVPPRDEPGNKSCFASACCHPRPKGLSTVQARTCVARLDCERGTRADKTACSPATRLHGSPALTGAAGERAPRQCADQRQRRQRRDAATGAGCPVHASPGFHPQQEDRGDIPPGTAG